MSIAAACVGALLCGIAAPAAADDAAPDNVWALVRQADGDVEVLHGDDALTTAYDDAHNRTDADVLSLETETPVQALGTNDPLRAEQWALDKTSFQATWTTTEGTGVIIAVVDSGVRADHEDLNGMVLPGIDLVSGGDGRTDPNGHGTHVAGIIAAQAGNARGIAGAAPDVRILPVRVLGADGSGQSSNVAAGIVWAADRGARVINISLGGSSPSDGMLDAMNYAIAKGAVVVAAAGNNGTTGNQPVYPAAYGPAIAVGAVEANLMHASFSSTGSYIDLSAPGADIVSTWSSTPNAYARMGGTSMAAPFVSASAALLIAANPGQTAVQARAALEQTASDLGAAGRDDVYGFGLVDPRAAVNRALPPAGAASGSGYWVIGADGRVQAFGAAPNMGDLAGLRLRAPIVGGAPTASGRGYWLAGADGAVYAFGDAPFHGSMAGARLNGPIVGISATPSGNGYVLLGADGGIFTFGDAQFFGSTGGLRLNAPILDLTMTPDGRGYWFVGADGGVFAFGSASFHGSTGGMALAAPVESMTAARDGHGYWTVALDGGVFAFDVPFHGSLPRLRALYGITTAPALRLRALPDGSGYYILGVDGSVYAMGQARFHGSAVGLRAVDMMLAP
jgi:type VII secretion-associated serine protease mycosin